MVITTNDGKTFAGRDARHIVRQMRDTQWHIGHLPKTSYMEEVAYRVQQMTGELLPLDSADGFLLGLQRVKLITIRAPDTSQAS